jgi:hypothetical protein
MRIRTMLAPAAIVCLVLGASQAQAAILTGVWFGEQKCERFDGHKFHTTYADDIMVITQSGHQFNMAALFDGSAFNLVFQGTVINDDERPGREGEAAFTECVTSPTSPYQETGRATKIRVRGNGFGQFDATSIFLQIETDDSPTDTGTCRWHYTRVTAVDPEVPTCATILSPNAASFSSSTTSGAFRVEPRRK